MRDHNSSVCSFLSFPVELFSLLLGLKSGFSQFKICNFTRSGLRSIFEYRESRFENLQVADESSEMMLLLLHAITGKLLNYTLPPNANFRCRMRLFSNSGENKSKRVFEIFQSKIHWWIKIQVLIAMKSSLVRAGQLIS